MIGTLDDIGEIYGVLSGVESLDGDLTIPDSINARQYDGEYLVIPNYENQVLETNGRLMTDDLEVMAIPVSIVENLSGGNTVYIGG